jgi:hypothetical protein
MVCRIQRETARRVPDLVRCSFCRLILVLIVFRRNFAASQVLNIGCAIRDKFPSKALAEGAQADALTQLGRVQALN